MQFNFRGSSSSAFNHTMYKVCHGIFNVRTHLGACLTHVIGGSGTNKSAQELTRRAIRKMFPHPALPAIRNHGLRIIEVQRSITDLRPPSFPRLNRVTDPRSISVLLNVLTSHHQLRPQHRPPEADPVLVTSGNVAFFFFFCVRQLCISHPQAE